MSGTIAASGGVRTAVDAPYAGAVPTDAAHPRTLGWVRTTALAMGGSNQSLFLLGALLLAQGSAAIPLLVVGCCWPWPRCRAGSSCC